MPTEQQPLYAPLSVPLWKHLVALNAPQIITPPNLVQKAQSAAAKLQQAHEQALLHQLASHRTHVDAQTPIDLRPGVVAKALAALGVGEERRIRSRITDWRRAGVLRPTLPRSALDRATVSALMLVWLLRGETRTGERERGWLPESIAANEPVWWCWRQDDAEAPVIACPVPFPADIPASARLWTNWMGAAFIDGWQRTEDGLVRWAK